MADLVSIDLLHPAVEHRDGVAVGLQHVAQRLYSLARVHEDNGLADSDGAQDVGDPLLLRNRAMEIRRRSDGDQTDGLGWHERIGIGMTLLLAR